MSRYIRHAVKTPLTLSLLTLVGIIAGCTSLVPEEPKNPASEQEQLLDVTDTEGPVAGSRTVTFRDWHQSPAEMTPMARARNTSPCAESNSYRLYGGGIRWAQMPVTYRFGSVPNAAWKDAVRRAFATWSAAVTALVFQENENSDNVVSWAPIDGPGGILAQTSFTYMGKQILGFSLTFDASESWGILGADVCPSMPGLAFDVQDIATHEIGHALGLGHASSSRDRALTMYPSAGIGETFKRSLGAGDKAGATRLYR